jgi:NAD(P)-dependent dehydrogenase (short-subunit alcohol dehydrogenase family)
MSEKQVAIVTGASSGFGELTADLLAAAGWHVYGTSRQRRDNRDGVQMLELDVTIDASADACIDEVLTRSGSVDLLINNAGRTHASFVEETCEQDARGIIETNFWGAVRMARAVLPTMRSHRAGRIITVGSLAGLVGVPGHGFYSASKHALEGFCESLAAEVARFGIDVSLVEPGFFKTNLHHSIATTREPIGDYDAVRPRIESAFAEGISGGGDPRRVAEKIVRIAQCRRPKQHYRIGLGARWIPRAKQWVPQRAFLTRIRKRFGLQALAD